jgi:hypothetical protein
LSTTQALDAVTEAATYNRRALFGGFVDELVQGLTADDLAAAATWLMKHADTDGDGVLARVRNACLKLCANHLHDLTAATAAVAATKAQLLQHERVLTNDESLPDHIRRQLALLVAQATDDDTNPDLLVMLICDSGALLSADDLHWLLDLANTADPTQIPAIHSLLPRLVDPTRIDHANAVLNIDQASPLRPAFSPWLDTCRLDDPAVLKIQEDRRRIRERRAGRANPPS